MMKVINVTMFFMCLTVFGCRPYDTPEYLDIRNSETVILSPTDGDVTQQNQFPSEELMQKQLVAKKRIQIPHKWEQTGRFYWNGRWQRTLIPTIIDRAPETRKWTPTADTGTSNKNEGLWAESSDSVGFSTGIECTGRIPDHVNAIKFLFNYPTTDESRLTNLDSVMDTEVRTKIQAAFTEFSNFYAMDELRSKKTEMMAYIKYGVMPADIVITPGSVKPVGVIDFFKDRGIEITTIGQFGGFTYENKDIQTAIDKVFEAQQEEEVAKAKTIAQRELNEGVKLAAEGLAEAAKLKANGEAEAIRVVADAKAYEIEQAKEDWEQYSRLKTLELDAKRLEKWDGKYPTTLFGSMDNVDFMVNPLAPTE